MARVNVYLPDHLARDVLEADLNVSAIAQEALRAVLDARRRHDWLDDVRHLPSTGASHAEALESLDAARDELGT